MFDTQLRMTALLVTTAATLLLMQKTNLPRSFLNHQERLNSPAPQRVFISQGIQAPPVVNVLRGFQVKQEAEFRVVLLLEHDCLLKGTSILHDVDSHGVNDVTDALI